LKPQNVDWIHTFTGKKFRPLTPDPELIDVRDVAHALATQSRFGGHTSKFYSVAEHSVRVSLICPGRDALWGLLHDASEAYLKDMASPIKYAPGVEFYLAAERALMAAVAVKFSLPANEPESVRRADAVMLHTEARDLFPPGSHVEWLNERMAQPNRISPLNWQAAEAWFLERFRFLERRRAKESAA